MTVDESPVSPPRAVSTTVASGVGFPRSSRTSPSNRLPPCGRVNDSGSKCSDYSAPAPAVFENFMDANPKEAKMALEQLAEVTGVKDEKILIRAYNNTQKSRNELNVSLAIDYVLRLGSGGGSSSPQPHQPSLSSPSRSQITQKNSGNDSLVSASPPPPVHPSLAGVRPQPSPKTSEQAIVEPPPTRLKSAVASTPSSEVGADADLEKAIRLSLQEADRAASRRFGAPGVSQEDQDVSRALEASLLESSHSLGSRRAADRWMDPLDPRERKRKGLWPVGLKNVGQTCWFSAVIQSLFYLPAFRALVLHYPKPLGCKKLEHGYDDRLELMSEGGNHFAVDDKHGRIVEFMVELRKLFALMVGSRRKYVDPSRAVDILRSRGGRVGTEAVSGSRVPFSNSGSIGESRVDHDQQDVSEFTHIVLEWVEEAFKLQSKACSGGQGSERSMETEKDKLFGTPLEVDAEDEEKRKEDETNPMTKLFYGSVLTEGTIRDQPFERIEAFGQWPLQVCQHKDIHESLESSTAHESLEGVHVGGAGEGGNTTASCGQERWFIRLPPVLFFELSRFQYNTERKTAEKIHRRLDFPSVIYMDRYVMVNKAVTRSKREEVKRMKDRCGRLKSRLERYTKYGGSVEGSNISLPTVLQSALDFAIAGKSTMIPQPEFDDGPTLPSHGRDVRMNSPASEPPPVHVDDDSAVPESCPPPPPPAEMQVDSPRRSPKSTPISSSWDLAMENCKGNASSNTTGNSDESCSSEQPMEVEGSEISRTDERESNVSGITDNVGLGSRESDGCDKSDNRSSATMDVDANLPFPRYISQTERQILQNCLSRWKQEVMEDMTSLEQSILDIENEIEKMYSEDSLKQLPYTLHAVMVHEGGVDSGHYWAYVQDHKRKVWLKFNDNAVDEASWEELLKESVGGHSNTSAYSLVYIDTSKPELLLGAAGSSAIGETQEDRMEEGEFEALAMSLPQDLAEYVVTDNNSFREELVWWEGEQERKKQMHEEEAKQQVEDIKRDSSGNSTSDVMVVKERLTHVNTHAKLSLNVTHSVIHSVLGTMTESSLMSEAVVQAMGNILSLYSRNTNQAAVQPNSRQTLIKEQHLVTPELSSTDPRLESFCIYLLKNNSTTLVEAEDTLLIDMALLEQLSLPGLKMKDVRTAEFRRTAESMLEEKRSGNRAAADLLMLWHQAYHWFRRSVHSFVSGLENFCLNNFEDALHLFTETYCYGLKVANCSLQGPCLGLSQALVVRFLCLTLPEVNSHLVKQFRLGEALGEVTRNVRRLIVPVLIILQDRTGATAAAAKKQLDFDDNGGAGGDANCLSLATSPSQDSKVLEESRNEWCGLLVGEACEVGGGGSSHSTAVPDILSMILEPPREAFAAVIDREQRDFFVDGEADLKLAQKYAEAVRKLKEMMTSLKVSSVDSNSSSMEAARL